MSGPIGRLSAALTTVHTENAVSLANLNVDFTLIKLEAPPEFSGVRAMISQTRKVDAEDGILHQTARKLGALFQGMLPSTPSLFKAYGKRVSEISEIPTINPRPSEKDGIFANQIGADATSIWAAVTSGEGAIATHLLACMLSRIFSSSEATSIWVELVSKRKEQICRESSDAMYAYKHDADILAAKQDLARMDLGNWDASARAWVQSADQAKALQHKQLMLILRNGYTSQ
jgi:hypothetical protein